MAYTKTTWVNDQQPDIDADNLNKMEQGIYDAQFPDGGTEGQLLARTANGQGWVDPPNSAVWGGITGDIEDQTDLQAALSSVGKVDSVNGIEPDAQKNVQVDVEITKQGWDALPSTKYTDNINYYIKNGTNIPQAGVISASGVQYDNTQSGLTADTVQEAVDENASAISSLSAGLSNLTAVATTYRDFTLPSNARTVLYPTIPTVPTGYRAVLLAAEMAINSKEIIFQGVANNNAMFYSTFSTALSGNDFPLYCTWLVIRQ